MPAENLYLARGPLTLAGHDWRSGDTFVASEDDAAEALASGMAELLHRDPRPEEAPIVPRAPVLKRPRI